MANLVFSEEELQALCAEWQEVLSLRDWDVKVVTQRERDFYTRGNLGEVNWVLMTKQAFIKILDPIDYNSGYWPLDQERILVHELVHLHFVPFAAEHGTDEHIAQEQAIELISKALVEQKQKTMKSAA